MERRYMLSALALVATAALPTPAAALVTIYGLTNGNQGRTLVTFQSNNPGTFTSSVEITGLTATTSLIALDFRPNNGQLYALARNTGLDSFGYALYTISTLGAATFVGNLGTDISSTNTGFDFNPQADLIRIVTNNNDNYTIDPATGVATQRNDVFYPGDNPNGNPNIQAVAYSNNVANANGTEIFVLDLNGDLLSNLGGNSGQLGNRGTLFSQNGLRLGNSTSFDIAFNGEAYLNSGVGDDVFYSLDYTTPGVVNGRATRIGDLQSRLVALTAGGPGFVTPVPEPASWAMMIAGFGLVGGTLRQRRRHLACA
jgi:hypothetical protein